MCHNLGFIQETEHINRSFEFNDKMYFCTTFMLQYSPWLKLYQAGLFTFKKRSGYGTIKMDVQF